MIVRTDNNKHAAKPPFIDFISLRPSSVCFNLSFALKIKVSMIEYAVNIKPVIGGTTNIPRFKRYLIWIDISLSVKLIIKHNATDRIKGTMLSLKKPAIP